MKRSFFIGSLFVTGSLLIGAQRVCALTVMYFTSTPGSWIGQGQTLTFPTVFAKRTFDLGAYTNTVTLSAGGFDLNINGPHNALPTVGYYGNVFRWPFNDNVGGMWFTAPGRGDNDISGWFNVLQAEYNPDGTVNAFAVDFRQFDELSTTDWTFGMVRYNSSVPLPEPALSCAIFLVAAPLFRRRRS